MLTTVWYAVACRCWRRALAVAAALLMGAGMAALYLFPLAFEWDLVQGDRAMMGSTASPERRCAGSA